MSTAQPQLFYETASSDPVVESPGAKAKMTNRDYHAHGAISNSKLTMFAASRCKYRAIYVDKSQEVNVTPAMQLGSLVHAMVLEPECVELEYVRKPECDRRTNAGKAIYAEFLESAGSREVIDSDTWSQAIAITEAIRSNPNIRKWLELDCLMEQPTFWIDPSTGRPCRCKMDIVVPSIDVVLDLKITDAVSPEAFANKMVDMNYDGQAAWYADGYQSKYGVRPAFVFIPVQPKPPYETGFYEIHEADLAASKERNVKLLNALCGCEFSGNWEQPHEREVQTIRLPRYASYRDAYRVF